VSELSQLIDASKQQHFTETIGSMSRLQRKLGVLYIYPDKTSEDTNLLTRSTHQQTQNK